MAFTAKIVPYSHRLWGQTCGYLPVLDASERFLELLYRNVYNKSAKVTTRMDGAQVEIREQESCFCRTQVPLVFGIAHGYSLTSFALDLYPLEQFNSE